MPSFRSIGILVLVSALAVPLVARAGRHIINDHQPKKARITSTSVHSFSATIDDEPGTEPGKRLDLVLKTGAGVRIRGWNKSRVWVSSRHRESDCPDAKISAKQSTDGVRVESRYVGDSDVHTCSINVEIQVPERYDVRIDSAGGSVVVEGLRGTIEGHTAGGEVSLSRVRGEVALHTGGGDIIVSDCTLDGRIQSGGGNVKSTRVLGGVRLEAGGKRYR